VARDHAVAHFLTIRITAGTKTGSQKTNPTCYLFFLRSLFFHLSPLEPETPWIAQFVDQKLQAAKSTGKEAEGEGHQDLPPQYCGKSTQKKVPKVTGNHSFSSNPRSSFSM
jgi:hypothetical protein